MQIRIIAFATAAETLGGRELIVDRPQGIRVGDLLDFLEQSHAGFDLLRNRLAVAVDGRLANLDDKVPEGSEVALLPPVSGGSPESPDRLTRQPIDITALLAEATRIGSGAQVLFLGRVRSGGGGAAVTHLTYDAYEPMAERSLERICRDLSSPETGVHVGIVHRLGTVPAGEPSVAIVTSSPHRAAAYEASRSALERLKKEVPIWKREHFSDGSATWREEERIRR